MPSCDLGPGGWSRQEQCGHGWLGGPHGLSRHWPSVSQPPVLPWCSQVLEEGRGRRDLLGCQPLEHTVHLPGGHMPFCCVLMPRLVFQKNILQSAKARFPWEPEGREAGSPSDIRTYLGGFLSSPQPWVRKTKMIHSSPAFSPSPGEPRARLIHLSVSLRACGWEPLTEGFP